MADEKKVETSKATPNKDAQSKDTSKQGVHEQKKS